MFFKSILLNDFELTNLSIYLYPKDQVLYEIGVVDVFEANDPIEDLPILLLKWAVSCFKRRYFGDISIPMNPMDFSDKIIEFCSPFALIELGFINMQKLIRLYIDFRLEFEQAIRQMSFERIIEFSNVLIGSHCVDPFLLGRFFGLMNTDSEICNYSNFFHSHFPENNKLIQFFMGLMSVPGIKQLSHANSNSINVLIAPDDITVSFIHITMNLKRHFIDNSQSITYSIFPSFSIVMFLLRLSIMSISEIKDSIISLPENKVLVSIKNQLDLFSHVKAKNWTSLDNSSIPYLLETKHYLSFLKTFSINSKFAFISNSVWKQDYEFINSFVAIFSILNHSIPKNIPKSILLDCFALIFLKNRENEYVMSFTDASKLLISIKKSLSDQNILSFYLDDAINKFSRITEFVPNPKLELAFLPSGYIYRVLLDNQCDINDLYMCINNSCDVPSIVLSMFIKMKLLPNIPFERSFNEMSMCFPGILKEKITISLFDYYFSTYVTFQIGSYSLTESNLQSLLLKRSRILQSIPLDFPSLDLPKEVFIESINEIIRDGTQDHSFQGFCLQIEKYISFLKSFFPTKITAIEVMCIDEASMMKALLNSGMDFIMLINKGWNIGIDIPKYLFANYHTIVMSQKTKNRIETLFPMSFFVAEQGKTRFFKQSRIISKYSSYYKGSDGFLNSYVNKSEKDYITQFMNEKSLFKIKSNDQTILDNYTGILPIIIEEYLKKSNFTENECDVFEDLLYFFDLSESWSSVQEICIKIDRIKKTALFETFSCLYSQTPFVSSDLNDVAKTILKKFPNNAYVNDISIIRSHPRLLAIMLGILPTNLGFTESVLHFFNIYSLFFKPDKALENSVLFYKQLLYLSSDKQLLMLKIIKNFDPGELLYQIAAKYGLKLAHIIHKHYPSVDCSKKIMSLLPTSIQYLSLISERKNQEAIIVFFINTCLVNTIKDEQTLLKSLNYLKRYLVENNEAYNLWCAFNLACRNGFVRYAISYSGSDLFEFNQMCRKFDFPDMSDNILKSGFNDMHEMSIYDKHCSPIYRIVDFEYTKHMKTVFRTQQVFPSEGDDSIENGIYKNTNIQPYFLISVINGSIRIYKNNPMIKTLSENCLIPGKGSIIPNFEISIGYSKIPNLLDALFLQSRINEIFTIIEFCYDHQIIYSLIEVFKWAIIDTHSYTLFSKKFSGLYESMFYSQQVLLLLLSAIKLSKTYSYSMLIPSCIIKEQSIDDTLKMIRLHQIQNELEKNKIFILDSTQTKNELVLQAISSGFIKEGIDLSSIFDVEITSIVFTIVSRMNLSDIPSISDLLLKLIKYLDIEQLDCVLESIAPILHSLHSDNKEKKQLLRTISCSVDDPERSFHLFKWFEEYETAFILASFINRNDLVQDIKKITEYNNVNNIVRRCIRYLNEKGIKNE